MRGPTSGWIGRASAWLALLCALFSPTLASADGANEYGGDLLKSGEGAWSLQSQADFADGNTFLLASPDIVLGLNGGFEALAVGAVRWDLEAEDHALDSLLVLLRYQLMDRFALGVGPLMPLEEEAELEGLVGLYYSRGLSSTLSFTTNLGAQVNGAHSDASRWWGVLTVQHAMSGGSLVYTEIDVDRGWNDAAETQGMAFLGTQFLLSEQESLNFFFSAPIMGEPGPLEQWGLGLIYAMDFGSAS